jgi:signal transduction histidine kinase
VRRLRDALRALNRGEAAPRLPEDGDDEIAEVNREYNALAERATRRRAPAAAGAPVEDASLVLRRMVAGLREEAAHGAAAPALLARVDALEATLDRLGSLAAPVDLQLAPVEPAALLHDVLDRFADEVVRRSVSTGVEVDPDAGPLLADRARLREAVGELVRNALDALPARGGSLRLRALPAPAEDAVAVEVEDDGGGLAETDLAWLYDGSTPPSSRRGTGLRLATSVVEQHGGRLQLHTVPGGGTTAVLLLPIARPADRRPARSEPAPEENR